MKNNIKISVAISCFFLGFTLTGQDFTETYNSKGIDNVHLEIEYGDITIQYWDKSEIQLNGSCKINAKDCKDALILQSNSMNNTLKVKLNMDFEGIEEMVTIYKPDGSKITFSKEEFEKKHEGQNYKMTSSGFDIQLDLTLFLPRKMRLLSESLYGSTKIESNEAENITIYNTYGSIDAIFPFERIAEKIDLRSTYNAVDLSLSEDINADLHMHTSYGEIYSNLNFEVNHQHPENSTFGEDVKVILNKGGQLIKLESNYGKIYLRKI